MKKAVALIIILVSILAIAAIRLPIGTSQSSNIIVINADGSVTGTTHIGLVNNYTYLFFANITGTIQIQTNNIVIDGAGYTLNGNGNQAINFYDEKSYVTVENLYIDGGILANGGGHNTLYNDYISNYPGNTCIMLIGSSHNNITFCTITGSTETETSAIEVVEGAAYNTVTESNLVGGINVYLSLDETFDRNYWGGDYFVENPTASEIDHSGIGDMPYQGNNHPLINPVVIPLTSSAAIASPTPSPTTTSTPTSTPTASIPEFPEAITVTLAVVAGASIILGKRKQAYSQSNKP